MAKSKSNPLLKPFFIIAAIAVVVTSAAFYHGMKNTQVLGESDINYNADASYHRIVIGASTDGESCLTEAFKLKISNGKTINVPSGSRYFLCKAYTYKDVTGCYTFTPPGTVKRYKLSGVYKRNIYAGLENITYYDGVKSIRLCEGQMGIFQYNITDSAT